MLSVADRMSFLLSEAPPGRKNSSERSLTASRAPTLAPVQNASVLACPTASDFVSSQKPRAPLKCDIHLSITRGHVTSFKNLTPPILTGGVHVHL